MATTQSNRLGPDARPVAVPDDVADPTIEKARGRIELPLHVRWSGPPKVYDLAKRADRVRVYEQVLLVAATSDLTPEAPRGRQP